MDTSYLARHDENLQYHYKFPLSLGSYKLNCEIKQGRLLSFYPGGKNASISLDFVAANPTPREKSRVECVGQNNQANAIQVSIRDSYAAGGQPGRIQQFFYVNGDEIFQYDIADAAWSGMNSFIVKPSANGSLDFVFELRAVNPDDDLPWGRFAATEIRLDLIEH